MAESKKELIVCIINNGFSDLVMNAARKSGAKGGTTFHARGTNSLGNKRIGKVNGENKP